MGLPDKWIAGAIERAGKTVAQTLATGLLALNIATLTSFTPIRNAVVVAVSAGVLSVFTSLGSIRLSQGRSFAKNTLLRAALTLVQTLGGVAAAAKPFNVIDFHWPMALATAGVAALASVLTSLASAKPGQPDSPSLIAGVD